MIFLSYFVTGASGGQGGATARKLLSSGHKVNALVRDLSKPSCQHLASLGANLIKGDYDDKDALGAAAAGCHGLFLNTMPTKRSEDELRHASNIINAAKNAGVQNIVYSSASRAEERESFPTWDPSGIQAGYCKAKAAIQELVKGSGLRWTIIQPAWIMTNWINPVSGWYWPDLVQEGVMRTAFAEDTQVHLVSPEDVGTFAGEALTAQNLDGEVIRLAGDSLTIGQIAMQMSEISGKQVKVAYIDEEERERMKGKNPMVESQNWQRLDGSRVDFPKLRSYGLRTTTFRQFLEGNKEALVTAVK